jgi:PleD family two-component response regulator
MRPSTLLDHAGAALRKAKATGRNRVCEYSVPSATIA